MITPAFTKTSKNNKVWYFVLSLVVVACILSPIASANFFSDIVKTITQFIGGALLAFAEMIVVWGTSLFVTVIEHTILRFGEYFTEPNEALQGIWALIRDIANLIIVVLFLVTAFGLVLGGGKGSGFSKKILLYLLVAALFVNLSAFFVLALIDISNALFVSVFNLSGGTEESLLKSVISDNKTDILKGNNIFFTLVAPLILCVVALFLFLAYLFLMLTLVHRFIAAILLVITSPIAVVAFAMKLSGKGRMFANIFERWKTHLMVVLLKPIMLVLGLVVMVKIYDTLIDIAFRSAVGPFEKLTGLVVASIVLIYGLFQLKSFLDNMDGLIAEGKGGVSTFGGAFKAVAGRVRGGVSRVGAVAGKVSSGIPATGRALALPTRFREFKEKAAEKKEKMLEPYNPVRNLIRSRRGQVSVEDANKLRTLEQNREKARREQKQEEKRQEMEQAWIDAGKEKSTFLSLGIDEGKEKWKGEKRMTVMEQEQAQKLEEQRIADEKKHEEDKVSRNIKDQSAKRPKERWEKEREEFKKADAERRRKKERDEKVAEGLEKERIKEEIKRNMEAEKSKKQAEETTVDPDGKPASGGGNLYDANDRQMNDAEMEDVRNQGVAARAERGSGNKTGGKPASGGGNTKKKTILDSDGKPASGGKG